MWNNILEQLSSSKIAGLFGAIVSIYFLKNLTHKTALLALAVGGLCAVYLTPLVLQYITLPKEAENGVAFLIGVFGMNIVGGIFTVTEMFRDKPIEIFKKVKDAREEK